MNPKDRLKQEIGQLKLMLLEQKRLDKSTLNLNQLHNLIIYLEAILLEMA